MAHTDPLGLYDQGFRHWLEAHSDATERLTGHVSESWDALDGPEPHVVLSKDDNSTPLRTDMDAKVVIWVTGARRAA